jgi:AAA ATPase domain/Adenylate and Guanylate cyclase catalytic domain
MMEALGQLNTRLEHERGIQLAVRLGIHTGLVVGDVGGGTRQEQLALGETPNLAAHLQGIAAPNTLVVSAATFQLLGGFFACQSLGTPPLKGVTQPPEVYQVRYESTARTRLEAAGSTNLTPLVGREPEVALLLERWAQVKDGSEQVVWLSGEAEIGKSRLVQVLTAQMAAEPQAWLTPCQCSPYYQNSALYPMQVGQITKGLEALAEGLATVAESRVCWWEAELCRFRGELLLRQTGAPPEAAEVCFHQALAVARRQQAKSWELSAAMSPARLWQQQGKRQEAYDLLASIYGWFTEGFDTADLQEAEAVLEALS